MVDKKTEVLYEEATVRLSKYPILRSIYDEKFLSKLVNRRNFDNFLLWLLTEENTYTTTILDQIEKNLDFIHEEIENLLKRTSRNFYTRFKVKDESNIFSYLTELEYISYFKHNHYRIQIEPNLPNKKKDT